jgi:RNA polymerase sigma-70 factor (ECF subfamily)
MLPRRRNGSGEAREQRSTAYDDGDAVRAISRAELDGDRIARLRTYLHQPEVIAEICRELGVPSRPNGYRHWW